MNGEGGAAGGLGPNEAPCRGWGGGRQPCIKPTLEKPSHHPPQKHNTVGPWARRASSQKLPSPAQLLIRQRLRGQAGPKKPDLHVLAELPRGPTGERVRARDGRAGPRPGLHQGGTRAGRGAALGPRRGAGVCRRARGWPARNAKFEVSEIPGEELGRARVCAAVGRPIARPWLRPRGACSISSLAVGA